MYRIPEHDGVEAGQPGLLVHAQIPRQKTLAGRGKALRLLQRARQQGLELTALAVERVGKEAQVRASPVAVAQIAAEALVAAVDHARVQVGRQLVDLLTWTCVNKSTTVYTVQCTQCRTVYTRASRFISNIHRLRSEAHGGSCS